LLAIEGAFVGAAFVGAASQVFRKSAIYPTWVTWGGLVIAVLSFLLAFPIHGVSLILVLPWVLVVSVLMLTRTRARRPGVA
jgi:RsiW-degrading membrane proteinase PrsW (M82 family)